MVVLPTVAPGAAVTVICWSVPGATERVIGVAVTPVGSEPTARLTFPVKPFMAEAVTVTVCGAPPGAIVIEEGETAIEKSPAPVVALDDPPPQPARTVRRESKQNKGKRDRMRRAPKKNGSRVFFFQVKQEGQVRTI
jgi:hypothetical protein